MAASINVVSDDGLDLSFNQSVLNILSSSCMTFKQTKNCDDVSDSGDDADNVDGNNHENDDSDITDF